LPFDGCLITALVITIVPIIARADSVLIDDFKTLDAWKVNPGGGLIHISPSPRRERLVADEPMLR
jgi:hypothetical protein